MNKGNQSFQLNEESFDLQQVKKYESLMTLGNGYMGIRGSFEESYVEQIRGMYVAGIYNKATKGEPAELVNLPDLFGMKIEIDNEIFSMLQGEILSYNRKLHVNRGEIVREVLWERQDGARFRFLFQRFVAKHDLHLLGSKLTVTSLDKEAKLKVITGIDAQQTNSGRQHLIEEKVRVFNEELLQGIYETTESNHTIALATIFNFPSGSSVSFSSKNRQLLSTIQQDLGVGESFVLEKMGAVYTSLDKEIGMKDIESISMEAVKQAKEIGYDAMLERSSLVWKQFWDEKWIRITSSNPFDQTAVDFAIYHLEIMTPKHDERFSVGAKGLTGEGYKGHVFWDSEIFILPFHLYTEPETAKKLLTYRYLKLAEAKKKADQNGYKGALFPWESALTGEEETPTYAAINIRTGKRQKIASAIAEHHIVADIAYAVTHYYQLTNDDTFMKKEGLALLKETSRFWISRTVDNNGKLFIKDVIGPDEYTEHIDNNAYTNYMAYHNVEQALYYMNFYNDVDDELIQSGREFLDRLYIPKANANDIIPQDDTFLDKPVINLDKYKANQGSQGILLDYSRQEVNEMQILKQADVVMLLYLFPNLFPKETVLKNLSYYEERTIHDSSLSKAIHSIVSMRCGDAKLAYQLFGEACLIDLGPNPRSSDEGIHAASLGAIWLTVLGFINISVDKENVIIDPKLPKEWTEVEVPVQCLGRQLKVTVRHDSIHVQKISGSSLTVEIEGEKYNLEDSLEVKLRRELVN